MARVWFFCFYSYIQRQSYFFQGENGFYSPLSALLTTEFRSFKTIGLSFSLKEDVLNILQFFERLKNHLSSNMWVWFMFWIILEYMHFGMFLDVHVPVFLSDLTGCQRIKKINLCMLLLKLENEISFDSVDLSNIRYTLTWKLLNTLALKN